MCYCSLIRKRRRLVLDRRTTIIKPCMAMAISQLPKLIDSLVRSVGYRLLHVMADCTRTPFVMDMKGCRSHNGIDDTSGILLALTGPRFLVNQC